MVFNNKITIDQTGFTLLEILIAIVVLSFLGLGVYSIVDQSTRTQTTVMEEDDQFVQSRMALERMSLDFMHFYSPLLHSVRFNPDQARKDNEAGESNSPVDTTLTKFEPSEKFPAITKTGIPVPAVISEGKDELVFMSSVNKRKRENQKQSDYAWIRYYTRTMEKKGEGDKGDLEIIRQFSSTNPYSREFDWEQLPKAVLMRNVKELEFQFWDAKRKKFFSSLRSIDGDKNVLRIIKILVTWVDTTGTELVEERIVRILWPFFDTVADDNLYEEAKKKVVNEKGEVVNPEGTGTEGEVPF